MNNRDPIEISDLIRAKDEEIAELKSSIEWLSSQYYGHVIPGIYSARKKRTAEPDGAIDAVDMSDAIPPSPAASDAADDVKQHMEMREAQAGYAAGRQTDAPMNHAWNVPEEEGILSLPPEDAGGMSVLGFKATDAIAVRPRVIRMHWKQTLYVATDGTGGAAAADAPLVFPDPAGGEIGFDISFAAYLTAAHIRGTSFGELSDRLYEEEGIELNERILERIYEAAAEKLAPVCHFLSARSLPEWSNVRRMFEAAQSGGDWFAEEFISFIHALENMEKFALAKAQRQGGDPETLYAERRSARRESKRIADRFFNKCHEMRRMLKTGTPLADGVAYALEHEGYLSEFLYNPRIELTRANPEAPTGDAFTALSLCAVTCRERGIRFAEWVERTLNELNRTPPPDFAALLPR